MAEYFLIIAIIVFIVVVWKIKTTKESLKTRRPVGYQPDPTAAKYWNGTAIVDCTACAEKRQCPTCPQFNVRSIEQFDPSVQAPDSEGKDGPNASDGNSHVGLMPGQKPTRTSSGVHLPSDGLSFNDGMSLDSQNVTTTRPLSFTESTVVYPEDKTHYASFEGLFDDIVDGQMPYLGGGLSNTLYSDLDPEFVNQRKHSSYVKGVCAVNHRSRFADVTNLGARNDDIFDGNRCIGLGQRSCTPSDLSTLRLLYKDTMGLNTDCGPAQQDCEFIGENGYLYKEDCNVW